MNETEVMVDNEDYKIVLERKKGMIITNKSNKPLNISKQEIKMASGLLEL